MPAINFAAIFRMIGIKGAIAIGLGFALVFTMWRADSLSEARDDALREVGAAEVRHSVTTASLRALQADMAVMVQEGELTRQRASEAVLAAQEAGEEARADAIEGRATGRTDWRGVESL